MPRVTRGTKNLFLKKTRGTKKCRELLAAQIEKCRELMPRVSYYLTTRGTKQNKQISVPRVVI